MRPLLLAHRYLGIALGVLMLMWCLSGVVMMYVTYPELSRAARLRGLEPIDWSGCCIVRDDALGDAERIARFQVEMLAGVPVLRLASPAGERRLIDLTTGTVLGTVSVTQAESVAADYAQAGGHWDPPRLEGSIDYDEWTVSGELDSDRPLFHFLIDDDAETEVYVSSATGRVVQVTTARERFWNWLGAVPHWLYFAELRRDVSLWSKVVIYTSLAGSLLAVLGIYIGVLQFVRGPPGRWSAHRGIMLWHHVPGLLFGVFALTWVSSGLLSMNPWGLLESASAQPERRALAGPLPSGRQVKESLQALAAAAPTTGIVSVDSAPLLGQLFLVATDGDGTTRRLDARGLAAPISRSDIAAEARALGRGTLLTGPQLLGRGDDYYFSHHEDTVRLPVYRVITQDAQETRYYLDPASGALLAKIDRNGRGYRWLHDALHRIDFAAAVRARPAWDVLMLALMSGVTLLCTTGAYIGLRRLARDLRGTRG